MARRSVLVTIAVATLMVATVSIASAAPGGATYACVNNNSGEIKIASGPGTCKANERELSLLDLSSVTARLQQLQQQIAGLQQNPTVTMAAATPGTPGATVTVGTAAALTQPPTPGKVLYLDAISNDGLVGDVTLLRQNPNFCSAHGPGVSGASLDTLNPLQRVQCGRAFGQTVSISGCSARISVHGYLHVDDPNNNYMGMTTLDIKITKDPGATAGTFELMAYTPRGHVQRGGPLTDVSISTCS